MEEKYLLNIYKKIFIKYYLQRVIINTKYTYLKCYFYIMDNFSSKWHKLCKCKHADKVKIQHYN